MDDGHSVELYSVHILDRLMESRKPLGAHRFQVGPILYIGPLNSINGKSFTTVKSSVLVWKVYDYKAMPKARVQYGTGNISINQSIIDPLQMGHDRN